METNKNVIRSVSDFFFVKKDEWVEGPLWCAAV